MAKKKRITCPTGAGKEIAQEVGVSEQTVSLALNFKTNSLLAIRIRNLAKEKYYGKLHYGETVI